MVSRILASLALATGLAACANLARLPAPPAQVAGSEATTFAGIPNARFVLGEHDELIRDRWLALERARLARGDRSPQHMLALSGGGDNGAFGAGILYGWTERGDRPTFELVTGVSTGALIAPLAFLGPRYDHALKTVYTTLTADDVAVPKPLPTILQSDSVFDTTPLARVIERTLTDAMIGEIAREYAKGRALFIGTTDLDRGRTVVWNIGAIAASGRPDAPYLIRKALLASAAIPGAFPPVMFDVEVNGQRRQELHVDGGATSQLFLYPATVPIRSAPPEIRARRRHAWIIRNGRTREPAEETGRGLLPIATRSISTMITANSLGDIYRTYLTTRRDGVDFNLAYITSRFAKTAPSPFDQAYMTALFEHGRQGMRERWAWAKSPPGYAR